MFKILFSFVDISQCKMRKIIFSRLLVDIFHHRISPFQESTIEKMCSVLHSKRMTSLHSNRSTDVILRKKTSQTQRGMSSVFQHDLYNCVCNVTFLFNEEIKFYSVYFEKRFIFSHKQNN